MSQKLTSVRFTGSLDVGKSFETEADIVGDIEDSARKSQAGPTSKNEPTPGRFKLPSAFPLVLFIAVGGCTQTEAVQHVSSDDVKKLPVALQEQVRHILAERCGTPSEPKMLGDASIPLEHLQRGEAVYAKRCQACHGVSGDGNGPAAAALIPRPRDYRKGVFKFTSTKYGARPRLEDLSRTVQRGIPGTSMPSFALLPKDDLESVIDYVKLLSMRGELETALTREAPDVWDDVAEDKSDGREDVVKRFQQEFAPTLRESKDGIVRRWNNAAELVVSPLTPQPVLTEQHVFRGRTTFLNPATGCVKCHGPDGRGQTIDNLRGDLKDAWGHATQAADLTSGMLRGGDEPIDLYRRILSGINGTPMPGFANLFANEPERIWDVVAFVLYVSNDRRRGSMPPAAIGPMPGIRRDAAAAALPSLSLREEAGR